jgi:hypothetical protein
MAKLYHITVMWAVLPVTVETIKPLENKLSEIGTWYRFSGWSWLLRSDRTSAQIREGIQAVTKPQDHFLVFDVSHSEVSGWALPPVWDWIRKQF